MNYAQNCLQTPADFIYHRDCKPNLRKTVDTTIERVLYGRRDYMRVLLEGRICEKTSD